MKSRGFTLAEVIAVVIIIAIIGVLTVPILTSLLGDNRDNLYELQLEEIKRTAEKWSYDNLDLLPDSGSISVSLGTLKKENYIEKNIINPLTNEQFSPTTEIKISNINNEFIYEVITEDVNGFQSDQYGPHITISTDSIIYLSVGDEYNEIGATSDSGEVYIQYLLGEVEYASIDTSNPNTYRVIYSASDNSSGEINTTYKIVTVIIAD